MNKSESVAFIRHVWGDSDHAKWRINALNRAKSLARAEQCNLILMNKKLTRWRWPKMKVFLRINHNLVRICPQILYFGVIASNISTSKHEFTAQPSRSCSCRGLPLLIYCQTQKNTPINPWSRSYLLPGLPFHHICKAKMNSIKTSRWQRSGIQDEDIKSERIRTADSWRSPGAQTCVKAQSSGASSVLLIIQHSQSGDIGSFERQLVVCVRLKAR